MVRRRRNFPIGNKGDFVRRGSEWSAAGRPVFWLEKDVPHYAADLMYVLKRGPIAGGKEVVQTCGDVACVNPAHLELRDA